MEADYDVVIMGGALAGASMGILLKRDLPDARILIVERSEAFSFKVGESTSEVAGAFLTRVLRLGSWLSREQIAKNGLRFWFNRPENTCAGRCAELGPKLQVRLPAYQLDRSKLDTHVLGLADCDGCEVVRPGVVRDLQLEGAGQNRLTVSTAKGNQTVTAKWVIDASGRASVIARHRGTLKTMEEHPTSSMWCRFQKVGDLDSHEMAGRYPEMSKRVWSQRSTATNHLTGDGWWAWVIPLQGGEVSVGVTWDRRFFSPPVAGTIPERLTSVLRSHPVGHFLMREAVPVEQDAHFYGTVAYRNTEVMGDGWATVGDASGFMDPLYSHGIDFIGNTTWAVHRMVVDSLKGQPVADRIADYNLNYAECYQRWFTSLYLNKYEYIGDAELMNAAVLMDVGCYFIGPVRMVMEDHQKHLDSLPYGGPIGAAFSKFMSFYNRRLAHLGRLRRERGNFGPQNLDQHYIFADSFQPNFRVRKLIFSGIRAWLKAEVRAWRHRPAIRPISQMAPEATPSAPIP